MKRFSKLFFFSLLLILGALIKPLIAQNTPDACTTCKNFCAQFSKPLSFNALSSAMTEVDEYCDNVQNPTPYDTTLCQKYSSMKVSFITNFSVKSSFMESLCGTSCKDECPSSDSAPILQKEVK